MLMVLLSAEVRGAEEKVSPLTIEGAQTIDAATAKALFESGALFIDVRLAKDWEAGHIPGAEHLELYEQFLRKNLRALVAPDEPIVFYCNGPKCMRSARAASMAVIWGYRQVYYFRGGYPAWQAAGFPIE